MSAGPVSDRVYASLRQRILTHRYRPGERLDSVALADQLTSSVTPIRDALNRLAGEGLVETHSGEGFYLPAFDEPGLADLYRWSGALMALAARHRLATPVEPHPLPSDADSHAARTAALFSAIARRSDNVEHARAIASCSARLAAARTVEAELFADSETELTALVELHQTGAPEQLRAALRLYHARRVKRASALVRLLYRSLPQPGHI